MITGMLSCNKPHCFVMQLIERTIPAGLDSDAGNWILNKTLSGADEEQLSLVQPLPPDWAVSGPRYGGAGGEDKISAINATMRGLDSDGFGCSCMAGEHFRM